MLLHPRSLAPPIYLILSLLLSLLACQPSPSSPPRSIGNAPDPVPAETDSLLSQTSRYLGQERFISVRSGYHWYGGYPGPIAAVSKDGEREIEEADLYALGAPGDDIVYVLNPYRGLQILDFKQTLGQKALIGRVPFGNDPAIEMYRHAEQGYLIVLQELSSDEFGHWLPETATKILVFDIKQARTPQLQQAIVVPGDYTDSRMVGDILYIATTSAQYKDNIWETKARLKSFAVQKEGLIAADEYTSPFTLRNRDSLQVIQAREQADGLLHTYAVLTLQARIGTDLSRESTLELVDLSDPSGKIQALMRVTTQGQVRERSAAFVHKGALIAVSNSWIPQGELRIRQVSVESFALPSIQDLRSLQTPVLEKLLPDAAVQTRDESGLHADIQDVRYSGDQLYVFWVPANQVDPLDVFDISAPIASLLHVQRIMFPGWIERAFPLNWKDQNYILALGWIQPEGTDFWKRQVQSILFRMSREGEAEIVSQLTLKADHMWSYFNDQDKSISWLPSDQVSGRILFPMQQGGEHPIQGAKLINYQLDPPQLSEGPTLAANAAGWLRRVFANAQLGRFHALSDRYFDSFPEAVYKLSTLNSQISPEASVELARDIRAYYPLGQYGLQIIQPAQAWSELDQLELRLTAQADSEKQFSLDQVTVRGRYLSSFALDPRHLAILTQQETISSDGPSWYLHMVSLSAGNRLSVRSETWQVPSSTSREGPVLFKGYYPPREDIVWGSLDKERVLLQSGRELRLLRHSQGQWLLSPLKLAEGCMDPDAFIQLKVMAGKAFLVSHQAVLTEIPDHLTQRLETNSLVPLLPGENGWACGPAINIPGRPLALKGNQLITEDQRIMLWQKAWWNDDSTSPSPFYPETRRVLISLDLSDTMARLRDLYDAEDLLDPILSSGSNQLYAVSRVADQAPRYIHQLGLGAQGRFEQRLWSIPDGQRPENPMLLLVKESPSLDSALLAWRDGRRLSIFEADRAQTVIQRVPLWERKADASWERKDFGSIPSFAWNPWRGANDKLYLNPSLGRLTAAGGLWGVGEWYVPTLISSP